jgi:hypothetical protein
MSKLLTCTLALLLMAAALPAIAADAPAAPLFVQAGPPDEFPGGPNACRIPPPFQRESCICPTDRPTPMPASQAARSARSSRAPASRG